MKRLVVLSGPSCAGKGPLHAALVKFYPDLAGKLKKLVLYNSRAPRPKERDGTDYHFRQRDHIEKLRKNSDFVVMDVRGDLQALDLRELKSASTSEDLFFEGNPFVGEALLDSISSSETRMLSAFLSPLSKEEIQYLVGEGVSLPDFVADVMRRKLLRRTKRQKGDLSQKDLENIERRAGSAYAELRLAHNFDYVIPNHDGEDSENWDAFYYPIGDARKALQAFVELLKGEAPPGTEKWEEDLIPD
jgi:guanylate kinase